MPDIERDRLQAEADARHAADLEEGDALRAGLSDEEWDAFVEDMRAMQDEERRREQERDEAYFTANREDEEHRAAMGVAAARARRGGR